MMTFQKSGIVIIFFQRTLHFRLLYSYCTPVAQSQLALLDSGSEGRCGFRTLTLLTAPSYQKLACFSHPLTGERSFLLEHCWRFVSSSVTGDGEVPGTVLLFLVVVLRWDNTSGCYLDLQTSYKIITTLTRSFLSAVKEIWICKASTVGNSHNMIFL